MTAVEGAPIELYKALFSILTGDVDFGAFLSPTPTVEDPRVYQQVIDFSTGRGIDNLAWAEYSIIAMRPVPIEQLQKVWVVRYCVHAYSRGIGGEKVDKMVKRVNELLNEANISTPTFFSWYNFAHGYKKPYEQRPELWHAEAEFETMCMAQVAD